MTDRQDAEAAKELYAAKQGQPLSVDPEFVADQVLDPIIAASAMSDEKVSSVTSGSPNVSITGTSQNPIINVAQTTAGLLTNVFFTADEVTTPEGTFYKVLINDKGVAASAIQTISLNDDESGSFAQDFLGDVATESRSVISGVYAGFPIVQVSSGQADQRFKIEAYLCDGDGVPLSGVGGGPVGTLGVNTVLIADSGIIDLQQNNPTSINCQGVVPSTLTQQVGQRFRYVFVAEKVGAAGGAVTFSLFGGTDYNSFFQIPTGGDAANTKSRYVINYAKSGAVNNIVALDTHSNFTIATGFYFGTGLDASLVGIRFTSGVLQSTAVGELELSVRYSDAGSSTQHTVGTGDLLTSKTLFNAAGLSSPEYNQSNELFFDAIPLVQEKVYFVDVSVLTFITITDLSVELIIEV